MEAIATTETLNSYCAFHKKENAQNYRLFEAELAKVGKLDNFKYLLRKEREGINRNEIEHFNLMDVPSWIRTCLVTHLGFSHEDFDKNRIPDLPVKA